MASKEIRRRTPIAFAEWLIELASRCKTPAVDNEIRRRETP
jgi:hypothetical protein